LDRKLILIASVCAAAAVAIIFIASSQGAPSPAPSESEKPDALPAPISDYGPSQLYKFNTECELIYSFVTGEDPSGEKMTTVKITDLVEKYPDKFAPWSDILLNNQTRDEFFNQPSPAGFNDAFIDAIMIEFSINPELRPVAELIADPQKNAKLQGVFDEYGCQGYFDARKNTS
jgi:hypothetical protein